MAERAFNRMGPPVRIEFDADSAEHEFDMTGLLPTFPDGEIRTDLVWMANNTSLYDCRLEGTKAGDPFMPVTEKTGWCFQARTKEGPYTSKKPRSLSVQAFPTNGAPIEEGADFSRAVLELQYGVLM